MDSDAFRSILMDLNEFEWIYFLVTFRWEPPDLDSMDLGVMIPLWTRPARQVWMVWVKDQHDSIQVS